MAGTNDSVVMPRNELPGRRRRFHTKLKAPDGANLRPFGSIPATARAGVNLRAGLLNGRDNGSATSRTSAAYKQLLCPVNSIVQLHCQRHGGAYHRAGQVAGATLIAGRASDVALDRFAATPGGRRGSQFPTDGRLSKGPRRASGRRHEGQPDGSGLLLDSSARGLNRSVAGIST